MSRSSRNLLLFGGFIAIFFGFWLYFRPVTFEHDFLYIQSGTRLWPIDIELAETPRQQQLGLMHRRYLGHDNGMLFIFPKEDVVNMWMKNTLVRLDMLFIDKNGAIVHIAKNTTPRSTKGISSNQPVKAVLELRGGITDIREIKVGDMLIHPIFGAERY